jgi:phage shock protein E
MEKSEPTSLPRPKTRYMDLVTWIIIVGVIVAFVVVKGLTQASPAEAAEWLKKGALVIDVRTEAEYRERHLPGTINIPLDRLGEEIAKRAPDKEKPLLLHCRSGARSGKGTSTLKKMGYRNVLNLGSYGSAEKILGAQSGSGKKG